jgi:hypothetical protein
VCAGPIAAMIDFDGIGCASFVVPAFSALVTVLVASLGWRAVRTAKQ